VAGLPPSPSYEPYLVERSVDPILARALSRILVRRGNRVALESATLEEVVSAIRFLAKPGRRKQLIADRVDVLLVALAQTTVFEKITRDTDLELSEFILSLKAVAEGREDAYHQLTKSAASVAPYLRRRAVNSAFLASTHGPPIAGGAPENARINRCHSPRLPKHRISVLVY